jgi:hypothetical protein
MNQVSRKANAFNIACEGKNILLDAAKMRM